MVLPKRTQVGFLIGSGLSMAAGLPGVREIDDRLQDEEAVYLHTDERYLLAESSPKMLPPTEKRLRETQAFADTLRKQIDGFLIAFNPSLGLPERRCNYEDVAYLARQISDCLYGEYENAALVPLLDQLSERFTQDRIAPLARNVVRMTEDIVAEILTSEGKPDRLDSISCVLDSFEDLGQVDVFNLNHDLLLEKGMASRELRFSDGFEDRLDEVVFWSNSFDAPIRHMKLHGSIDWEKRIRNVGAFSRVFPAKNLVSPALPKSANGLPLPPPYDDRPLVLTGTFDKGLAYHSGIFAEMHSWFTTAMRDLQRLIVIGYGFRDKALNSHIVGWLYGNPSRKMILVHGNPEQLFNEGRRAISNQLPSWERDRQISLVPQNVSADLAWSAIKAQM